MNRTVKSSTCWAIETISPARVALRKTGGRRLREMTPRIVKLQPEVTNGREMFKTILP